MNGRNASTARRRLLDTFGITNTSTLTRLEWMKMLHFHKLAYENFGSDTNDWAQAATAQARNLGDENGWRRCASSSMDSCESSARVGAVHPMYASQTKVWYFEHKPDRSVGQSSMMIFRCFLCNNIARMGLQHTTNHASRMFCCVL